MRGKGKGKDENEGKKSWILQSGKGRDEVE